MNYAKQMSAYKLRVLVEDAEFNVVVEANRLDIVKRALGKIYPGCEIGASREGLKTYYWTMGELNNEVERKRQKGYRENGRSVNKNCKESRKNCK